VTSSGWPAAAEIGPHHRFGFAPTIWADREWSPGVLDVPKEWLAAHRALFVGLTVTNCYVCCTPMGGCTAGVGRRGSLREWAASPSIASKGSPMRTADKLRSALIPSLGVMLVVVLTMALNAQSAAAAPGPDHAASTGAASVAISITTVIWLLMGLVLLVVGLLAASTAGKQPVGAAAARDGSSAA